MLLEMRRVGEHVFSGRFAKLALVSTSALIWVISQLIKGKKKYLRKKKTSKRIASTFEPPAVAPHVGAWIETSTTDYHGTFRF